MHVDHPKKRLALLASGSGTNVANFINYFGKHANVEVALVVSDRAGAYVLERAAAAGVPHAYIDRKKWQDESSIIRFFSDHRIDAIILAGFLMLVPSYLVRHFEGRILNIHPALLPDFGGKGMYGMHVHKAVLDAGARESGISIHLVDEEYDRGHILFQAKTTIDPDDTPDTLAAKVHALEYAHYPQVVEAYLSKNG